MVSKSTFGKLRILLVSSDRAFPNSNGSHIHWFNILHQWLEQPSEWWGFMANMNYEKAINVEVKIEAGGIRTINSASNWRESHRSTNAGEQRNEIPMWTKWWTIKPKSEIAKLSKAGNWRTVDMRNDVVNHSNSTVWR
jgi:hypothetical protein